MKEKLEFLLRTKNLTATTLARMLEIQPSGLSHILSGRNKPSFDLVVKILKAFPDINPDWLLLNDDSVYRDLVPASQVSPTQQSNVDHDSQNSLFGVAENIETTATKLETKNELPNIFATPQNCGKTVERIIILYSDKSFDSYSR